MGLWAHCLVLPTLKRDWTRARSLDSEGLASDCFRPPSLRLSWNELNFQMGNLNGHMMSSGHYYMSGLIFLKNLQSLVPFPLKQTSKGLDLFACSNDHWEKFFSLMWEKNLGKMKCKLFISISKTRDPEKKYIFI